jgi:transcriptional regulator with XRE-family HTH domain
MENIFRLCDTGTMNVNTESAGVFIRNHRIAAGLTQKELAEAIGMTDRSVTDWEAGRTFPSRDALAKMAHVFRISLDEFRRFLTGDIQAKEYQESIKYLSADEKQRRKQQALRLIDELLADPQKLDQWVDYGEWLRGRDLDESR